MAQNGAGVTRLGHSEDSRKWGVCVCVESTSGKEVGRWLQEKNRLLCPHIDKCPCAEEAPVWGGGMHLLSLPEGPS